MPWKRMGQSKTFGIVRLARCVLTALAVWTTTWTVLMIVETSTVVPDLAEGSPSAPPRPLAYDPVPGPSGSDKLDLAAAVNNLMPGPGQAEASTDTPPLPSAQDRPIGEALGLMLIGTVAGEPSLARAVLVDSNTGRILVCRVGQELKGATIVGIERDLVVLRYDGQARILPRTGPRQASASARLHQGPGPAAQGSQPAPRPGTYTDMVGRILELAQPIRDGLVEGLRLRGLDRLPQAKDLGLSEADLIQTINGHKVTSGQKALQILRKARGGDRIEIGLLRDGQAKTLSFALGGGG